VGSLDLVSISAGKFQGIAPCADISTGYRSSGHQADDANFAGMKTENRTDRASGQPWPYDLTVFSQIFSLACFNQPWWEPWPSLTSIVSLKTPLA
jgi:hypothetical protein